MKIKQKFSDDKAFNIISITGAGLLALSIIPVLLLSFYNYPGADDFSAGDTVYRAWNESKNLIAVLQAAFENVIYNYREWSGVFASVFWSSLQPGIFGEKYYGITAWITMGLVIGSVFYLFYVIFQKYLQVKRQYWCSLCLVFLFLMIHCMPSGVEGLYWHPGAANYTWAHAFYLLLLGFVLSAFQEAHMAKRTGKLLSACVLAVFVGGGNYITALQASVWVCFLTAGFYIYKYYEACKGKEKTGITTAVLKEIIFILPAVFLTLSFLTSILAPGNQVRMATGEGMNPWQAILHSYIYALKVPMKEWFSLPMLPGFVLSFLVMIKIVEERRFWLFTKGKAVLIVAGLCFSSLAAGFTPNLYAQGTMEAGRLHNTVYFIWIMVLYLFLYVLASFFAEKKECKGVSFLFHLIYEKLYYGMIMAGILCLILLWIGMPGICIGSQAMESLTSGQAKTYKEQQEERLKILKDENVAVAKLPPLTNPPGLLLFQDITDDPNEWINQAMAEYYGKLQVVGIK